MDTPDVPNNPSKHEEFEAFLALLKEGTRANWLEIAEALAVNKDTISAWKKHPLAIQARREGIEHALENMKRAGKDDWRMWDKWLDRLKLQVIDKKDITSDGEVIKSLIVLDTHESTS